MPAGSYILGSIRLVIFFIMAVFVGGAQAVVLAIPPLRKNYEEHIPMLFHSLACKIFGIEIEITGIRHDQHPVLFVANHSSYIDIPVLGSIVPGCFIAKAEVADWPMFGTLARLQRTIFVHRRREDVDNQRASMIDRVGDGLDLILFPEGTSSDGIGVLPFKSSLFSIASMALGSAEQRKQLTVQPVAIACNHLDGLPLGRDMRHVYSWYGDMDLFPHLWRLGRLGHTTVTVAFLDPIPASGTNRKRLAQQAEDAVREAVDLMNAGLPVPGYQGPDAAPDPASGPTSELATAKAA
ncbi:MAG: lysophospholipid acyltransferase family protein [Pseudomonadota bacterium]